MKHRNLHSLALSLCLVLGWQAAPALGQFVSGSDMSDGIFNATGNTVIDLALAPTGPWDSTPHAVGVGVYDPVQWAVVFQYDTINVDAVATVTFKNHPKGAPVVWLATGDVTIAGQVRLDGANGTTDPLFPYAIPGPGGFSGGIGRLGGSAGFGPGGGGFGGGGGSYGTLGDSSGGLAGVIYGMTSILPLIGGSGGGGSSIRAGGAGGGGILIASSMNIVLDGGISANGGGGVGAGAGSGGGIRLIANGMISGSGLLQALGATFSVAGGNGRIRVEAPSISLGTSTPPFTQGPAVVQGIPVLVFPAASAPVLRVKTVDGKTIPTDPQANVLTPEVAIGTSFPVNVEVELSNMPQAAGMVVDVRIVQGTGGISQTVQTMPLVDDGTGMGNLTATAVFDFTSPGSWEVQLSLPLPLP